MCFTGCTLAQAAETITGMPAQLLGLRDRGRLQPGMRADLVLLDADDAVLATWVGGELAFDRRAV